MNTGRIIKNIGGLYHVEDQKNAEKTVACRAKGAFRRDQTTPLVGDFVEYALEKTGEGFITAILPRKNSLVRPAVSNVDLLCIVAATEQPSPDFYMLDKLTALAAHNGIEILLALNKADLAGGAHLTEIYEKSGIGVIAVSCARKDEYRDRFNALLAKMRGKTTFFAGASGVGKTSLINTLFPSLTLETGELSKKISRGKHTTRCTSLYKTGKDSYIGDTPGFSMLEVASRRLIPKELLVEAFLDIARLAGNCRYKRCTHLREDGCFVIEAVKRGLLSPSRHESYKRLFEELKDTYEWELKDDGKQ